MPLALMRAALGSYATSDGLGKNVASSMCQEVADHGLASSISAFNLSYTDAGLFGVIMTAPDNKLDDLLWYVMPNLVRLAHGISDEELARRLASWTAPPPPMSSGYWKLYVDHVLQADEGVDLDFLVGKRGSFVPRDNH